MFLLKLQKNQRMQRQVGRVLFCEWLYLPGVISLLFDGLQSPAMRSRPCSLFHTGVMSGVEWRGSPCWPGIRLIVQEGFENTLPLLLDEVANTGCVGHHYIIGFVLEMLPPCLLPRTLKTGIHKTQILSLVFVWVWNVVFHWGKNVNSTRKKTVLKEMHGPE